METSLQPSERARHLAQNVRRLLRATAFRTAALPIWWEIGPFFASLWLNQFFRGDVNQANSW